MVPGSIAVLSGIGLEKSAVWKQRVYGNQVLWNGAVGDDGKVLGLAADDVPEQPPDVVLCDSVRRFKGLERPVIVLLEVPRDDPDRLDRLLYIGASRATQHLVVIAPTAVLRRLGESPGLPRLCVDFKGMNCGVLAITSNIWLTPCDWRSTLRRRSGGSASAVDYKKGKAVGSRHFRVRDRRWSLSMTSAPSGREPRTLDMFSARTGRSTSWKSAGLSPGNQYVAANEWVAAELARAIGLPILAHDTAEFDGHVCFAAQYMPKGTWHPNITRDLFDKCLNNDRAYGLVVLDAWVCNTDRHSGNLLVRSKAAGGGELMLLNDHSHCLVQPGQTTGDLGALIGSSVGSYVQLDFIREAIADLTTLEAAIGIAEAVSDSAIRLILDSAPTGWWVDQMDLERYERFLVSRRN